MKKGVRSGVGSGSGSISQRYGSRDPDQHQNVTYAQHDEKYSILYSRNTKICIPIAGPFFCWNRLRSHHRVP
jgi:hypothetical protein